jgi:hypothetical protein
MIYLDLLSNVSQIPIDYTNLYSVFCELYTSLSNHIELNVRYGLDFKFVLRQGLEHNISQSIILRDLNELNNSFGIVHHIVRGRNLEFKDVYVTLTRL